VQHHGPLDLNQKKDPVSMTEYVWDKFLTERDKAVFAAGGFGARAGFGKRPALLVIDVNWLFCGDKPEPILDSIKRWRSSCGEESWVAVEHIRQLVESARGKGLPVIYTTNGYRPGDIWDAGSWRWKNSRRNEDRTLPLTNFDPSEIVAPIAPGPRDIVIVKQKPSGFFGTNLGAYLTLLGCDSVIVTGSTTSGCVRATAVDAFSMNYRVALAEEGCFDRSQASHALSLCDMHAKYADVVKTAEVLSFFASLPNDLFELPEGTPVPPARMAAE
jgi:maleamate amidohydrolase